MSGNNEVDTTNTSTPSAIETPILTNDASSLQDNEELISALAKQLQYYFSSQNLAKDTYLNTIMQLNSGCVPISILTGFANVNRIVVKFAGDVDIADIDVQSLLQKSALGSNDLKIVLLGHDGLVLATHGDDGFEAQRGPLTFDAIGSRSDYISTSNANAKPEGTAAAVEEADKKLTTVILRDVPESATEEDIRNIFKTDDSNVVAPTITSVQKEVGQCW
jgi:hypothetical protein